MSAPVYTADKAERLIRAKKVEGEYHVTGSLDLSGCDLTGVTLPASVGGSLDLRGAQNPDSSQWWREFGEATERRCIAISDYALIQIGRTDPRFTAGCRKNLTVEQALAHWGEHRTDARAKAFRKAISAIAKARGAA